MLVNGDCQWITTLHYAFQDDNNLVRLYMSVLDEVTSLNNNCSPFVFFKPTFHFLENSATSTWWLHAPLAL